LNKPSFQPDELKTDLSKNGEPCPKCAAQTLLRRGKFGFFYSCSKYPSCDGLIRITTKNKKAVKAKASKVKSS
jgi:DNA topoisomerase-3